MSKNILISPDIKGFVSTDSFRENAGTGNQRRTSRELELIRREVHAEAEKKLQEKLAAYRENQKKLWSTLETSFQKFENSIEQTISDQLIDLSLRIAEIIIQRELPDRAMIRNIVRKTLEPLSDLHGVRVRLSPDDAKDILSARQGEKSEDVSDLVEIIADPSLTSGDVLIESRNGFFDAQITERLKLLKQHLRERYRNANADSS